MVAKLWADKVIDKEKKFSEVPAGLKKAVKKNLINRGFGNMAVEDETETTEPVNNEPV